MEIKEQKILETRLEELNLSVRSFNQLKRAGINNLQDLLHRTKEELHTIGRLGKKYVDEIISELEEYGIVLNQDGELIFENSSETEKIKDSQEKVETIDEEDKETEELESMSEEELQQIIANNNQIIQENNATIKKALVERIIAQQKTIARQQLEISELNSQKKEL